MEKDKGKKGGRKKSAPPTSIFERPILGADFIGAGFTSASGGAGLGRE